MTLEDQRQRKRAKEAEIEFPARASLRFHLRANLPETWWDVAYELIGTANLGLQRWRRVAPGQGTPRQTFPGACSFRVPMMLYAFALEALLKALWLAQGRSATRRSDGKHHLNADILRDPHKLLPWWRHASMRQLSEQERKLLEFLTLCVEMGRYPVKKTPQEFLHFVTGDIKPDIIRLLKDVDRELRRRRVRTVHVFGPPRLATLGIRSTRRESR